MSLGPLLIVVLFPLALVLVIGGFAAGPVRRRRLVGFARRQNLVVTPTNGERVIRYLAVTRRWRTAGVMLGITLPALVSIIRQHLHGGTVGFNFGEMFAGWFVGALIAELRLSVLPSGPRRAAALRRRTPWRYMGRAGWAVLGLAFVGLVVATAIRAIRDGATIVGFVPLSFAVIAVGVVVFVARRVVDRPQPHLPDDELAADEAIRSRSIHVLCGSGIAVTMLCLATVVIDLARFVKPQGGHMLGGAILLTLAGPVIGYYVATAAFAVEPPEAASAGRGASISPVV
jgi:hypothetical protein